MSTNLKKHKRTNSTITNNDENKAKIININDVIDDNSLIGIFEHLPVKDLIKIEMVCKRWSVIGKLSWSRFNTIQISYSSLYVKEKVSKNSEILRFDRKMNIILCILQRCGKYLNDLIIELTFAHNNSKLLNEISKCCNNIIHFKLIGCDKHTDFCIDNELSNLFKINENIKIVKFNELKICGSCLSFLPLEKISDLTFTECSFKSLKYFYEAFYKVKSLKRFITDIDVNPLKILTALNESKCVGLQEFKFFFRNGCASDILTNFLAKQKKLEKLECYRLLKNKKFSVKNLFHNLPYTLQELAVDFNEDASFEIKNFKNLSKLKCFIQNLTDNIVQNINYCKNLKILKLVVYEQNLTKYGEKLFANFDYLEVFTIEIQSEDVNKILTNLSHCKNLRKLSIHNCLNLDNTFEALSTMKNLSELKIGKTNGYPIYFIKFIEKALNLNIIHIYYDNCLSIDLLKQINAVKIKRDDKNILHIYIHKRGQKHSFIKLLLVHVYLNNN